MFTLTANVMGWRQRIKVAWLVLTGQVVNFTSYTMTVNGQRFDAARATGEGEGHD